MRRLQFLWSGKSGEKIVNELINLVRSFGVARLGAIIGVTFGVAVALSFIIARIGAPSMGILYADLSFAEAQNVISQLEQDNTPYKLRDDGARMTILVPRDTISNLRMHLASDGVIVGGGVGYEIFDNNQTLGATSFQQNINRLRALEGELARTIASLSGIRTARVHLVLPERELFARDKQTASASIVVDAPGGLDNKTVRAIVNLAASAAPGLDPSHVTVLDTAGRLLASGADSDSPDALASSIEDKKVAAEARIRKNVEDIVSRIVGADNARVEIVADMDFSRITESSEIVDPDSQTVLSSTTVEETSNSADPRLAQGVTVANALPGAQASNDQGALATSSQQRTEETTNYEISKTMRNAVHDKGFVVKRLSVAVAVNSAAAPGPDSAQPSVSRTPEELARIEMLVKSAIGYDASRGDQVSVVEVPFTPLPAAQPGTSASAPSFIASQDVTRLSEVGALALIAFGLVVFVLRPMLKAPDNQPILPPAGQNQAAAPAIPYTPDSALEQRIDLAQVEGQVKASSINKVSEIVKAHTDESAGILRNWMREAS